MALKTTISLYITFIFFIFGSACPNESLGDSYLKKEVSWAILTSSNISDEARFSSIHFFDTNIGVSETVSTIEMTDDGGKNWRTLQDFEQKAIYSLFFTDNETGWLVGTERISDKEENPLILIFKRNETGSIKVIFDEENWATIRTKFTTFYDICINSNNKAWIVGDGGVLASEIEGSKMKVTSMALSKSGLFSVACNDKGEAWAAGDQGSVYFFQNEWKKKTLDPRYSFLGVKLIDNEVWFLGYKDGKNDSEPLGILLNSKDKGKSWEDKTPANSNALNDLYLENGNGWLVGRNGNIFHSVNNGNSWVKVDSPTRNNLNNIYSLDENHIWISGDRKTILKLRH